MLFRVWGFRGWGFRFRITGLGFRVWRSGLRFRVQGSGFNFQVYGLRVKGFVLSWTREETRKGGVIGKHSQLLFAV